MSLQYAFRDNVFHCMRVTFISVLWSASLLMAAPAHASDVPPPADPDLPQPLDVTSLQALITNPPFTRVVDFTDSLRLTGVATVGGKPMATLLDTATKKQYVVSDVPNAKGWKLLEANESTSLRYTQVKVMVGPEVVTLRYSDDQLNPKRVGGQSVRYPTAAEAIRKDENGKEYVRGSAYLSQQDQDIYHNKMSREAHDKFREIIRDSRDKMFQMSDEQRAAFSKKIFDKVLSTDQSGQKR